MFSKVKMMFNSAGVLILYSPFCDEVDPATIPLVRNFDHVTVVVPNKNFSNPFDYSVWLKKFCSNRPTIMLIPGQQFDLFGTRRGRGGGWYDRLLSQLPTHWQRIGVARGEDLTHSRLLRQRHDEPMDWLICRINNSWRIFEIAARKF